jgi:creatinine amidohydrolase
VDRLEAGVTTPVSTLMPQLRARGVQAVSPNGVLGDPAGATAADGRRLLDALVDRVVREIADGDVRADVRAAGRLPARDDGS